MKKITVILFAALLAGITVFEGCKKYEDGPGFSLRSRKERVANTWKVEKVLINGVEQSFTVSEITTFDKDGVVSSTILGNTYTGTWKFVSDDEKIEITMVYNGTTITGTFTILKLKEKEFWVLDDKGTSVTTDDEETHYIPAK